jgi:hypothetical protein
MDGSDMSINFPQQGGNPLLLAKRVKEAIEANQIAIAPVISSARINNGLVKVNF